MLYAVRYDRAFPSRREESAFQRELARRLLFWAVRREYGAVPEELDIAAGPWGKPAFSHHPAQFSLSHCSGLACCFLSEKEGGVDAERLRSCPSRLAERICTPEERVFLSSKGDGEETLLSLWTLKESLMKLTGDGFRLGFRNAAFSFPDGRPVPRMPGVQAACFSHVPGFVISVCCRGELPETLQMVGPEVLF